MDTGIKELLKKIEQGELNENEQLQLLRELNFSYDILNKFIDEVRIVTLKADII